MSLGSHVTSNDDALARARSEFHSQPFMQHLGAYIVDIAHGRFDLAIDARPEVAQQHGYVHAGALSAILDTACGFAALTTAPADRSILTAEFKVNLLRPATGGRVLVRAQVIKPGRTLVVCQAHAVTADAAPSGDEPWCALMTATMACVEPPQLMSEQVAQPAPA